MLSLAYIYQKSPKMLPSKVVMCPIWVIICPVMVNERRVHALLLNLDTWRSTVASQLKGHLLIHCKNDFQRFFKYYWSMFYKTILFQYFYFNIPCLMHYACYLLFKLLAISEWKMFLHQIICQCMLIQTSSLSVSWWDAMLYASASFHLQKLTIFGWNVHYSMLMTCL